MAAGSSLWLISSLFLLVFVTSALSYTAYDIASDRVCSRVSKRELSLSMSRPLLVRDTGRLLSRWSGVHSFRCKWEVESKGGTGVVGVIQLLKFRRSGYAECADYVQFMNGTSRETIKIKKTNKKEDVETTLRMTVGKVVESVFKEDKESAAGPRLCGNIMFGNYITNNGSIIAIPPVVPSPVPPTPPPPSNTALSILSTIFNHPHNPWAGLATRGAAIDPNGELKTTVYVEAKALRMEEVLELAIVFTGFQKCDGRITPPSLFHCGYGLCIHSSLVNDGLVNCPFGDCIDEKNCTAAMASNLTLRWLGTVHNRTMTGISPGVTATSSFFGIAVLVTIAACICFLVRKNKQKRDSAEPEGEAAEYPTQQANGEYVGVPTETTMQNADLQPPVAAPYPPAAAPGAPPIGFCVPQQEGGLPPVGAPYPSATAPMQYPPQPHQYPTAGAPYPVQPQAVECPPPYTSLFPADKN